MKERKKIIKSKRPSTYYISSNQTLTSTTLGIVKQHHSFQRKPALFKLPNLLYIIQPNTFLKLLSNSKVSVFPNKLTHHCFNTGHRSQSHLTKQDSFGNITDWLFLYLEIGIQQIQTFSVLESTPKPKVKNLKVTGLNSIILYS